MADNTKIWPIFRSANWGLSDDLYTGIKNSFYYSNQIEIREDDKSIFPKQTVRQSPRYDLWEYNTVGEVVAARYFNWNWYIFCQKDVLRIDVGNNTAVSLATRFSSETWWIKDAELFNWYVYISTWSYLYRIAQNAADVDRWTKTNFTKMSLNNCDYHPLYATDVIMVVGNYDKVSKVTKEIPDQVQDWITLQTDYKVKFINELWWFIRVIAEDWYYWAELLLWDKVSDAANEIIPMNWYKFLQSRIYNWYHYLLSNKGLWLVNWYQYYILKRIPELQSYDKKSNWMIVYDDKLYFVKSDWIYIYWAKNKNYNDVLNLWTERYDTYWQPRALATDWEKILYTESSRVWWLSKTHVFAYVWQDWYSKWASWEFQTMAYFWTSMSEIKQSMYLRVWYNIAEWWNINIYYRTEADAVNENANSWEWHTLTPDWLWIKSDMRSPFATTLKLNCKFQWIQFKFVLEQSTLATRTKTRIYSADLYYNAMLD